ncbi:MAG: outer membrane protein, partial [Beijerinckiaceae bacterium]
MYKKFFSVLATSAIIALPAFAADIPAREAAPAPAPVYAPPVFTWAGLYAGVNMGAGWRSRRSIFPGGNFLAPGNAAIYPFATVPVRNGGDAAFTAGLTLGYNWQFGNVVAGLEGDINYLGTGRQNKGFFRAGVPAMPFQVGAAPNTLSYFTKDNGRFFGTARARLGYAFDRTLFFATGGLAFRGNRQNNAVTFA